MGSRNIHRNYILIWNLLRKWKSVSARAILSVPRNSSRNYTFLCDQARKALFSMTCRIKTIEHLHLEIMFNLVDTLIKPILTYSSDVQGSRSTLRGIINKVFLQFLGASCNLRRQQAILSLRVMNTSVRFIFKDGFMFTLYVRKLVVDVFKAAHTFIVWLFYCSYHIVCMITFLLIC